jgi:hypothetical protein
MQMNFESECHICATRIICHLKRHLEQHANQMQSVEFACDLRVGRQRPIDIINVVTSVENIFHRFYVCKVKMFIL